MSEDTEKSEAERVEAMKRRVLPMAPVQEEASVDEWSAGSGEAPAKPVDPEALRETIVAALKTVHDPEIPVNIYDLGLIYGFDIGEEGEVELRMTLTAPGCPVAGELVREVAEKVGGVEGVSRAHVKLVWDPPWSMERMTEEAQLELGLL